MLGGSISVNVINQSKLPGRAVRRPYLLYIQTRAVILWRTSRVHQIAVQDKGKVFVCVEHGS
jgi:hypothetical protein